MLLFILLITLFLLSRNLFKFQRVNLGKCSNQYSQSLDHCYLIHHVAQTTLKDLKERRILPYWWRMDPKDPARKDHYPKSQLPVHPLRRHHRQRKDQKHLVLCLSLPSKNPFRCAAFQEYKRVAYAYYCSQQEDSIPQMDF